MDKPHNTGGSSRHVCSHMIPMIHKVQLEGRILPANLQMRFLNKGWIKVKKSKVKRSTNSLTLTYCTCPIKLTLLFSHRGTNSIKAKEQTDFSVTEWRDLFGMLNIYITFTQMICNVTSIKPHKASFTAQGTKWFFPQRFFHKLPANFPFMNNNLGHSWFLRWTEWKQCKKKNGESLLDCFLSRKLCFLPSAWAATLQGSDVMCKPPIDECWVLIG